LAEAAGTEDGDLRPYTYAFATAVTWSRVELERHSVWQALAGAALGYGIARASASCEDGLFGGLFVDSAPQPAAFGPTPFAARSAYREPTITLWRAEW
jgi:hypothetical protein